MSGSTVRLGNMSVSGETRKRSHACIDDVPVPIQIARSS